MNENPNYGILSPLHYGANGIDLDSNFENYYNKQGKITSNSNIKNTDFVNAAAWLVSKKCFEKVGLFDPIFSHYGEDRNFCDRVKYHGFKIGVVKNAAICHDRMVKLNSNKIELQSKYLVLNQMINCNNSLLISLFQGLKSVFGLSKFHFSSQGVLKTISLFIKLLLYYFNLLLNIRTIIQIRKNSIKGINGVLSL